MNNKMAINALNASESNAPLKGHKVPVWITKQDPYICCLQETHCRSKDT